MSNSEYKPMTVGNWLLTFILLAIPLVNVVMLLVWALGATTHPSKMTFGLANFVILAITTSFYIFAVILPTLIHHHHHIRTGV